MGEPPSKRLRSATPKLAVVLGQASRIVPSLKARLGSDWKVESLSLEEASAGKVNDALVIITSPLPAVNALIARLPCLRLVQSMAAGIEFLDLDACPQHLTICNTNTMDKAIAEYAMSAMLHWQVQLREEDRKFREAKYFVPPFRFEGYSAGPAPFHGELGGKILGIVGFGHIGSEVARRAAAFDMRVLAVANRRRDVPPQHVDWCGTGADLHKMLSESHFVVVCCSLTSGTWGLINADALACMRTDAVFINVARGHVVDEDALYDTLKNKRIRGAVLDVWWQYPTKKEPEVLPSKHPFHELDNVMMTPHSSGWTSEQEERKLAQVAHNTQQAAEPRPSFVNVCRAPPLNQQGNANDGCRRNSELLRAE
mmetsp:Transcript_120717/g.336846  ORF Transcript_120717/g.336846 Transcript_120717/m.336846 type:complete len:369 (+) Transcript_120717:71-1177(+)